MNCMEVFHYVANALKNVPLFDSDTEVVRRDQIDHVLDMCTKQSCKYCFISFLGSSVKIWISCKKGDHGGENVQVAEYLRSMRNNKFAYIQGPFCTQSKN